jgi:hypothetical protein
LVDAQPEIGTSRRQELRLLVFLNFSLSRIDQLLFDFLIVPPPLLGEFRFLRAVPAAVIRLTRAVVRLVNRALDKAGVALCLASISTLRLPMLDAAHPTRIFSFQCKDGHYRECIQRAP